MKKPKISTKTSISAREKQERILRIMGDHPEGVTPGYLSSITRINPNTIKSALKKLLGTRVKLKEGMRGIYLLVENDPYRDIFSWNFHNAFLNFQIPNYIGEAVDENFDFGIIRYIFTIGKESRQASLHIVTDYPLNLSSLCSCGSYFILLIKRYTGTLPNFEDLSVSCIEFNKDYANLKLEGTHCITLTNLLNQFKVYEKKEGVRVEHKITVPIGAGDILSLLTNQVPYLSLINDMSRVKENIHAIESNVSKILKVLSALLRKKDDHKRDT